MRPRYSRARRFSHNRYRGYGRYGRPSLRERGWLALPVATVIGAAALLALYLSGSDTHGDEKVAPHSATPTAASTYHPETAPASNTINYYWVGGQQIVQATAASVKLDQVQPRGVRSNEHSLAELNVSNRNGTERVEVGWTDDPALNGTERSALFINATVDGQSVYSGDLFSGFVQTSKSIHPGDPVKLGIGTYAIKYDHEDGGRWEVDYDGQEVGYYPEANWHGGFTHADFESAFGEVATSRDHSEITMGNGWRGSSFRAARISGFRLFNGNSALAVFIKPYAARESLAIGAAVDPGNSVPMSGQYPPYSYGFVTNDGLNYGGPGVR